MADYQLLSIIVPVFNERNTVGEAIRRLREAPLGIEREIIIIDDGSQDGTADIIKRLADSTVRMVSYPDNRGKGAAVRRGIEEARGDLIVVQDADLEYDPRDLARMLRPLQEGQARVVYGSRFTGERRNMFFWHWVGNRFLSLMTNVLFNTTLSDMETCYKMFDGDLLRSLNLSANRFDFEPEVTAKALRLGVRIWEVPITYAGREVHEGKKISWRDGFPALLMLLRVRLSAKSAILK
ncbi:MAG: glycosyltransferase family 2 protein [Acidimicrobiia bacterium]|nr:glycosyltransferase family 2 protein [Acidimicrobiia bacterium]